MAYTRIQHRRGTTAQWNQYDPVLGPGEIGVDLTTKRLKMGNGSLKWSELDYFDGTAYDTAVKNGFTGTEEEWLLELVGPPAEISIGTVTTLPPGSDASASISGTAPSYTLNFEIPRGNPGTDIHFAGSVPTVADLPSGAASNDAYIVDEDGNLWVSDGNENWADAGQIVGPQGPQGIQGETGPAITFIGSYPDYSSLVSSVTSPNDGDAYIVSDTQSVYVWNLGQWNNLGQAISLPNASPTERGLLFGKTNDGQGTASLSISLGANALESESTGLGNIAIGRYAAGSTQSGNENIAIGTDALFANVSGFQSVAIGSQALRESTQSYNIAIGHQALNSNISGSKNVAIGHQALTSSLLSDNVAIGYQAMYSNTGGDGNVAIGANAMSFNFGGSRNVFIGRAAGGSSSSGTGNIFIGYNAGFASPWVNVSNTLLIANDDVQPPIIHGNFSTRTLNFNADVSVTYDDPTQPTVRTTHVSTSDPSGGNDGDVWLKYTP